MGGEASPLVRNLLQFGCALRTIGLDTSNEDLQTLLRATALVSISDRERFRAAARAALVRREDQLEMFDRAFDLFWTDRLAQPPDPPDLGEILRRVERGPATTAGLTGDDGARRDGGGDEGVDPVLPGWTAIERLKRKDFAKLTDRERAEVATWIAEQPWRPPKRRARRERAGSPGRMDVRRTLRASLRHGGEPMRLLARRRVARPRPLVVLCDISGSMEPYSRVLLRFMHALSWGDARVEAFVFGTQLTRITRHLESRDADRALASAAAAVADWDGGTRIGDSLRAFHRDWAHRVLRRGAVVLVISDGWDRGDPDRLSREMAHLHRSAWRLLWLNPLLGSPGYRPLTRGIRAVLPNVDAFLPVHDLASLEQLADLLASDLRRGICWSRSAFLPSRP